MIKRNTAAEKRTYFFLFFVLFGLIFARYCYYGFRYFPQLDDYIQYHNYAAYGGGFGTLVKRLGLLSSRPLAGLLDYFVWTRFYGCMIAAVAVISAMYASSAVFFHRVFSKHFGTGQLFFIIYALLPLGFEGTYWLSASSRIVAGLFFTSLSFLFFDNWCGKGARRALVPFIVFQLAAFCLYEQLVLLSGALTLLVMLLHLKQPGIKRAAWGSFMFVNAAVYLAATKLAPAGVYGERTAFFLPWQAGYLESGFLPAGWQIVQVFSEGVLSTSGRGLIRGIKLLAAEPNALWVLAVLLLCFALYFFTVRTKRTGMRFFAELIAGLFLALAPLSLFFVLEGPWFSLRNTVTSFCGLALVCDALFDLVFGRLRIGRAAEAVLAAALALACSIASVSELHDYRETAVADVAIASAALETLGDSETAGETLYLLNVDPSYVLDGNFYYHEHDYGCTSSAWALTGLITAVGEKDRGWRFVPVSFVSAQPVAAPPDSGAQAFWYMGGKFIAAALESGGTDAWRVRDAAGSQLGMLIYADGGLLLRNG